MTKSKKRQTIQSSCRTDENVQFVISAETSNRQKCKKGKKLSSLSRNESSSIPIPITNIILHLKCSINDLLDYEDDMKKKIKNPLEYNPNISPVIEIKTYHKDHESYGKISDNSSMDLTNENYPVEKYTPFDETQSENYSYIAYHSSIASTNATSTNASVPLQTNNETSDIGHETKVKVETEMKDINTKLKHLKVNLFKNNLGEKKSACFWCTFDFDNEECYIPKYSLDEQIFGYGSFCRPECAAAYLMKEDMDDSTKFERFHLLNQIYGKVFDYKRSIKPSPNPYYLLEKYYGTLTIQEYRKLLKSDHLLTVLDKPLTRVLPELHEDNDDIVSKSSNHTSKNIGMYKVKLQTDKQTSPKKANILKEHFGL